MAQPASKPETCNKNNSLNCSPHRPQCNKTDLFPFPGFTINNRTDVVDYTPVTKTPCGSVLKSPSSSKSTEENSSSGTTKTPPVVPSVSPEIQSRFHPSILVSGPSTCYGAGHLISGVTDGRKCKARGLLSAARSKPQEHDDIHKNMFEKSSPCLIPSPTEASIIWHLSPSCGTVLETPQEERILSLDFNGECSPFSSEFLSSGNVMQTPNSDSSFEGIRLKHKFESELDQVTDVVLEHESLSSKEDLSPWDPPRLSSEFEELSPPSEMRISWKDEVTFNKDDLDCCRLLSDEEIDADGLLKSPRFSDGNKSNDKKSQPL